ncbi:hypothetical protein DICVIV_07711 [Dictyocaulus viviparus]|uniref:RING-type domain-containing protein n=1 Tax=Dictyocaulus viviparus TaxID=29172 RepID=A0A0D8XR45_DICVI|nr:hypothetical protein DICVIV_07711 [Dictyocaulus viviparus]
MLCNRSSFDIRAYILRCGHSFCELCLDDAVNRDDRCPECRRYTYGICIPNRRLNECIFDILLERSEGLQEFRQRVTKNQAILTLRRKARSALFSIFCNNSGPVAINKIEEEWKAQSRFDFLPDDLRTEMLRIINSDKKFFKIFVQQDDAAQFFTYKVTHRIAKGKLLTSMKSLFVLSYECR